MRRCQIKENITFLLKVFIKNVYGVAPRLKGNLEGNNIM